MSTSRSSARAIQACGPRTRSNTSIRRCVSRCWRACSRVTARQGATAAGAPRSSRAADRRPRSSTVAPRSLRCSTQCLRHSTRSSASSWSRTSTPTGRAAEPCRSRRSPRTTRTCAPNSTSIVPGDSARSITGSSRPPNRKRSSVVTRIAVGCSRRIAPRSIPPNSCAGSRGPSNGSAFRSTSTRPRPRSNQAWCVPNAARCGPT